MVNGTERRAIVILSSETLGRGDDSLGAKLMASFLGNLVVAEPLPEAIVFYNAAVRLLSPASPHGERLRQLDEAGVDLLACVTCLDFYGLTNELVLGHVSNMREIVKRLLAADKVITA